MPRVVPPTFRQARASSNLANSSSALHVAAEGGHLEVLRCLLDSRADTWEIRYGCVCLATIRPGEKNNYSKFKTLSLFFFAKR